MTIARLWSTIRKLLYRVISGCRHPNLTVPGALFAGCIVVFMLERLALLLVLGERFAGVGTGQLLKSFLVGVRFDIVMAAMVVAPVLLILCVTPRFVWGQKAFRFAVSGFNAVLFAAVSFACTADFFFFREFDTHLDWKVFNYWEYDYVHEIIAQDYPLSLIVLAFLGLGAGAFFVFRSSGIWRSTAPLWGRIVIALLMPVLAFLGIRNSLGPKPINTGPAYFSKHLVVSQLTLNGLFTLREAAYSRYSRQAEIEFDKISPVDETKAQEITRSMLKTEGNSFVEEKGNPLRRKVESGRPRRDYNVVIVVMESLSWQYIGALNGRSGLTPNLDRVAQNGILMDRCFAVGSRTSYGFSGIVSGFVDLPGESVTTRPRAENNFLTIGSVLRRRGYHTMFVYGGQAIYDHRQAFLGSNGFNELITYEDFNHTTFQTELGWCDGDLFREANARFKKASAEDKEPFCAVLLTLSFHRPFKIPSGKVELSAKFSSRRSQYRAVKYTDWAIGRFIKQAKEADYFENTIFVFTADHTGGAEGHPISPANYRVPFIVYAPDILGKEGRRVSRVCSQTDIAPTVLSLLGGTYEHGFMGTSVLRDENRDNFAFMRNGSHAMALIGEDRRGVIVPFRGEAEYFELAFPGKMKSLEQQTVSGLERRERQAWALQRTASRLFYDQLYQDADARDAQKEHSSDSGQNAGAGSDHDGR